MQKMYPWIHPIKHIFWQLQILKMHIYDRYADETFLILIDKAFFFFFLRSASWICSGPNMFSYYVFLLMHSILYKHFSLEFSQL